MATVEIRDLTKIYPGGVSAVESVNATIGDGEFVVLVGPSGCGKSTILRMIAGLETITGGDLLIDGARVNDREPGERDIAMVFQNYALYPHMTVRRNMEYGLRNEGRAKDEIARRISEAARMLRLEDYLDRKPRQLSGGQRQRVAMGRAIVRDPKVFLFDEPLSNLDAKLRTQLRAELKALHDRLKATFVYVTHDQVEAMSLADRIAIMNAGRIEQIGTPMEVYQRPATRFVADFIGNPAMNFIEGRLDEGGHIKVDGTDVAQLGQAAPLHAGAKVIVGVRPEHLSLDASDPADGMMSLSMAATFQEQLGADTVIHGKVLGTDDALTLRLNGIHTVTPGQRINLGADTAHLHFFDAETGARLSA